MVSSAHYTYLINVAADCIPRVSWGAALPLSWNFPGRRLRPPELSDPIGTGVRVKTEASSQGGEKRLKKATYTDALFAYPSEDNYMLPDEEKARLSPEPSDRREQLYEVSVFLFLIIPSMTLSFFVIRGQESSDFVITAVFTILRDLGLVALLLFFLWRNGEAWNLLGWAFKNGWK
jgi:hypothetical protein